jgi:mevalonate pyrophosphate decarboxylase
MTTSTSGKISRHLVERFMTTSNQIYLVMDAGTPVAAFTLKRDMQSYLRRKLDTFCNPLVYTFQGSNGPSIIAMSKALAE